jgi:hypothetical protein
MHTKIFLYFNQFIYYFKYFEIKKMINSTNQPKFMGGGFSGGSSSMPTRPGAGTSSGAPNIASAGMLATGSQVSGAGSLQVPIATGSRSLAA